ncbi:uncharacterized protein RCC_03352 [Ramularia collo-cygni]|uniref:Uncharacterized protein n=1 Tax=Ramularia collo-cygni TaxID=112498 RepID=A0A2D3US39_9PEZI|nr:uncharacterized protein RCC_03352 [Ramularia collo-cygni]CZT17518.1 uncharacterized protein RCC_03352 [Ramularia collo-cygni]
MAPVTPSPHRFVAGHRRQASPAKESRLRQEALININNNVAGQPPPGPSASQFARAPRFAFGRAPQTTQPSRPRPLPSQRLIEALRTRPADDVEEQNLADDDEMLDVEQTEAFPSVETGDELRDLPYSPKRRRYSIESPNAESHVQRLSPNRPTFRQPATPVSHVTAAHFARPASVSGSSRAEDTQTRRPAFLRASLAPSEQHEPLPEAFSPHRRGEKFVPGGMAATLQQWVIETGQNAAQSRRGQGYLRGEDYVLRCTVLSISGKGPFMIRGKLSDGTEVKLLLVANSKQTTVAVGSDVGVRAPLWNIQLDSCSWQVGVDWRMIE